MTIDLIGERRLSLAEAARLLDVHISTVWRWANRGARGHKLATAYLGGARVTTREAIGRFIEAINPPPDQTPADRSAIQRQGAIDRAESELKKAGI